MDVLVAAAVTVSRWGTTGSVVGTLARTSHSAASGSQGPLPPAGRHDTPEAATLHTGCLYTACQQRTEGLKFDADIADTHRASIQAVIFTIYQKFNFIFKASSA